MPPPLDPAKIKARRTAMHLTLQEAADRATVILRSFGRDVSFSRHRWHDAESGRYSDPNVSTVLALAAVLDCTVEDLVTMPRGAQNPKPPARRSR